MHIKFFMCHMCDIAGIAAIRASAIPRARRLGDSTTFILIVHGNYEEYIHIRSRGIPWDNGLPYSFCFTDIIARIFRHHSFLND